MSVAGESEFRPTETALSFLFSPDGRALLRQIGAMQIDDSTLLRATALLRRTYPSDVVAAALDLALLRTRARAKFRRADEMYLTRIALEQASAEVVSRYRAERLARYAAVADLCCGIGGDTLALAVQATVLAVDLDPVRLCMAKANADVYEVGDQVCTECADATGDVLPEGMPFWADPSRRVEGRRVFSLVAYQPSLASLLQLMQRSPAAGIKLSPGVNYGELERLMGVTPYEVEIISVRGEAREAVLWLGDARTGTVRRATLLPGRHTLTTRSLRGRVPVGPVGQYLYEPDAAVIRAHLVEHLAEDLSASKIDEQIAYLTSDVLVESPFVTAYRVHETFPFRLKQVNQRLRAYDVGELVIKKRGLALDPEQLRRRLKYTGTGDRIVLVLTRIQDRPTALICRPVAGSL
jgi:hypothetical protein